MTTTGISTLDHAPQVVAEWLNQLCESLDWHNKKRAYHLLRSTLHALRDYLAPEEAANLSAQLPILLRGIYFEGWTPARTPIKERDKASFFTRIEADFQDEPLEDTQAAVVAVFDLLRRHVSAGQIDQIAKSMRQPLRDLWA